MAAEMTRHKVWSYMLDAARNTRYADRMETRYRRFHNWVRYLMLLFATASFGNFLDAYLLEFGLWAQLPDVLFAVLVTWTFIQDYATKIAVLNSAKRECGAIEARWRELWQDTESGALPDAEVRRRNRELFEQMRHATASMDTLVSTDEKVNVASTTDAYKVMKDAYAR